jgi:hypothetical protein
VALVPVSQPYPAHLTIASTVVNLGISSKIVLTQRKTSQNSKRPLEMLLKAREIWKTIKWARVKGELDGLLYSSGYYTRRRTHLDGYVFCRKSSYNYAFLFWCITHFYKQGLIEKHSILTEES